MKKKSNAINETAIRADNLLLVDAEDSANADSLALMLASSIHEVKNHFGKLVFAINNALEHMPAEYSSELQERVNSEIRYISNQLSQILVLYKEYQMGYSPNIEEVPVGQLLRETRARHLSTTSDIQISTACDDDLIAFVDDKFVINVLDTIIYNAVAAGAKKLLMSARQDNLFVRITIEDDGPGLPQSIIDNFEFAQQHRTAGPQDSSSFGLGLFFAQKILALHTNENEIGRCTLENGSRLGGAVITLYFP